ncbi:MAG: HAD family hydrolase [Candidatus Binatia bacterium]
MPPNLLIFDFDGTLADTWRDIGSALNATLVEAGLATASGEQVRAWVGEGVQRLLERAAPQVAPDAARLEALIGRFREIYAGGCLETTVLYPGVRACLDQLAAHRLAILSNKPEGLVRRIAEGLGIAARFAAIAGGDTLAVRKPDPATIAHVARLSGAADGPAWMIGDSAVDVATGRAAGARTIGCAWGLRGAAELRAAGVDHLVEHPAEIPPLVAAARSQTLV